MNTYYHDTNETNDNTTLGYLSIDGDFLEIHDRDQPRAIKIVIDASSNLLGCRPRDEIINDIARDARAFFGIATEFDNDDDI